MKVVNKSSNKRNANIFKVYKTLTKQILYSSILKITFTYGKQKINMITLLMVYYMLIKALLERE